MSRPRPEPHPVNPARPRPLPAPRPNPPQPKRPNGPSLLSLVAPFAAAILVICAGLTFLAAGFGEGMAWNLPTDIAADVLLIPLFVVSAFVSFASSPAQRHRAQLPVRASGALLAEGYSSAPSSSLGRAASAATGTR